MNAGAYVQFDSFNSKLEKQTSLLFIDKKYAYTQPTFSQLLSPWIRIEFYLVKELCNDR